MKTPSSDARQPLRIIVSAGFGEGHALPALALSRALLARGHRVLVELSSRWRASVESLGAEFAPAREYRAFSDGSAAPGARTVIDAARDLEPAIAGFRPHAMVADLVATAPPLAAERAGVPVATLIPVVMPIQAPGQPPFELGFAPARTRAGAAAWRGVVAMAAPLQSKRHWQRRLPALIDHARRELGLAPLEGTEERMTTYGPISDWLSLVATFPQLEHPRRWPPCVHVTGPMVFDSPHAPIDVPPGDGPLVLVAASTVHSGRDLVRTALAALASEPVRVVATINRRGERWDEPVPANATVVDWLSYEQLVPLSALVVSNGGHGTVVRALAGARPVLVCPAGAESAENGARVSSAGAGMMLPRRLLSPRTLRLAVLRAVGDERLAERARELASWARAHDGPTRGAELIERYVAAAASSPSEPR